MGKDQNLAKVAEPAQVLVAYKGSFLLGAVQTLHTGSTHC